MKEQIIAALHKVRDPEIPMDVYEMGLIYDVRVGAGGLVFIRMTLTAPNCPVAGSLPGDVERAVRAVPGVTDVKVELTFDPPWSKDRMSEAARLALGMDEVIPLVRLRR
jgi:FeS assembly SUF system protein